jgi:glycerol-3-phosphate dehydrogenase
MPQFPEFSVQSRKRDIEQLQNDSTRVFDLLIVGGGITGAAVAREASLRGLSTLLVEKGDFASGTSSRSSKLVHGGVRYLEQFEFALVMESTRERARLWKLAPQLVHPIPFLFPAFKESRVPLWKLAAGLWLYDILAAFRSPTMHRTYLNKRCRQEEPALRSEGLSGGIFYWDGATDDSLLTLANLVDARANGAVTVSRLKLDEVKIKSNSGEAPHEFVLEDQVNAQRFNVKARSIVVAGGPWTDIILRQTGLPFQKLMATTRGSHIVVPHKVLPTKHALAMTHPTDGRVLFTIPWGEFTVVGTTDIFDEAAPEKVAINTAEVDYLIESTKYYYPNNPIQRSDIVSTWSGLRPLIAPPDAEGGASQISREHHLEWRDQGVVVIAGGKLTTHREMAEETVDMLLRKAASWPKPLGRAFLPSRTHNRPFPTLRFPLSKGFEPEHRLGQSEASRVSLNDVKEICRTQMVMSIEDLFVRRTQIFYKEPHNGWLLLPKIKKTLCEALEWDENTWKQQVHSYFEYIETNVLSPLHRKLPEHNSL